MKKINTVKHPLQDIVGKIEGMNEAKWVKNKDPNGPYQPGLFLYISNIKAHEVYETHPNHTKIVEMSQGIVKDVMLQVF